MTLLILCVLVQYQRDGGEKKSDQMSHKNIYIPLAKNGNQILDFLFFVIPHTTYFPHVIFSITLKVGHLSKE